MQVDIHTAAIALEGDVPVEVYNTNADANVALSNGEIDAYSAALSGCPRGVV